MTPTPDDLASMACFARVVEERSFSGAARALGWSKSAVSKRVAALETRVGARLLVRTTRRLETTESGEAFYTHCARMLGEAEAATAALEALQEEPSGLLRVNGPVLFGEMHLVPLIPQFLARFPKVSVELTLTDRFIDPVAERQDVTVRITRLHDSSLVARRLAESRNLVVASPAYLARAGTPKVPQDLTEHTCIHYTRVAMRDQWRFRGPDGEFSIATQGRFASDSGTAIREAAEAGLGVCVLPWFMVEQAIAAGRLVELMAGWMPQGAAIWAIHTQPRHVPAKVRSFVDMLQARVKGCRYGAT
ncbi:MAG: LysR family transcriptional regulator [Myxococcota bacterium]